MRNRLFQTNNSATLGSDQSEITKSQECTSCLDSHVTYHTVTAFNTRVVCMSWFISFHRTQAVDRCHGFDTLPVHDHNRTSPTEADFRGWGVHHWIGGNYWDTSVKVNHLWNVGLSVFNQTLRFVQLTLERAYRVLNLQKRQKMFFKCAAASEWKLPV